MLTASHMIDNSDLVRKGLIFIFAVIGTGIFYTVLMTRLEVSAHEVQTKIGLASLEMQLDDMIGQYTNPSAQTQSPYFYPFPYLKFKWAKVIKV